MNLLKSEYTCQKNIENFSRGDRISIAEGRVLPMPNGEVKIEWENDKDGEIKIVGNDPYFYVLRIFRGK